MSLSYRLLSMALLASIACGDPVASGSYEGEPIFRLHGQIVGDAGTSSIRHPYLGVLWADMGDESPTVLPHRIELLGRIEAGFLSREFSVALWDPPRRNARPAICPNLAIGFAIAVDDVDGNGEVIIDEETGTVRPPDLLIGMALDQMLIWLDQGIGDAWCLLSTPGVETPSGYFVSEFDPCTGASAFTPTTRPFELRLLPPSGEPPDELDTCVPPETDPDCELQPDAHAQECCIQESLRACNEVDCAEATRALTDCLGDARDDHDCDEEMKARSDCVFACVRERCEEPT